MHISIIMVIAVVAAALIVAMTYGVYAKIHSDRRKRIDK
jgi:ABC-type dipeptide/oligopeptide/nickel transport system permease subunit